MEQLGHAGIKVSSEHLICSISARLHFAPSDFHSHVSTGHSPFIPSSHLTKGWRSVFLTERVRALLRNVSRYSVLLVILRMHELVRDRWFYAACGNTLVEL